jgi:MFS family permease
MPLRIDRLSSDRHVSASRRLFRCLWSGQLISNLGTQTSLYGIGLWLFAQSGRLLDFGLVALVVQLARILALPLLATRLNRWPPARVMVLAHAIGAFCTMALAWVLLGASMGADQPPSLLLVLLIQGVAAMAEAMLVVRFSSLIPVLIADGSALIRANGLFATTDGLVVTMAPFLGTWLVGARGLEGVLTLDALSFLLAMLLVLMAPWREVLLKQPSVLHQQDSIEWHSLFDRLRRFWLRRPQARPALLFSVVVMGMYAGCEILFPAWVAQRWGATRMAGVLMLGSAGYLGGFMLWRLWLGRQWWLSGRWLLLIQGLILFGAGMPVLSGVDGLWFAGVFVFSLGLPVVTAALHQAWVTLAQKNDPSRVFALRYGCEWSSRLLAFLSVSLLADRLVGPQLEALNAVVSGQSLALLLSALGIVAMLALGLERRWLCADGASIN